jgi:hypothetical protein
MFVVLTRQVQAYDVKAVVEKGGENAWFRVPFFGWDKDVVCLSPRLL